MASSCAEQVSFVPLAGNCYITTNQSGTDRNCGATVSSSLGLVNWVLNEAVASVYFKIAKPVQIHVSLWAKCVNGQSQLRVSSPFASESYIVNLEDTNAYKEFPVGQFTFKSKGYVRIDIQGIEHSGNFIGDVAYLILRHPDCGELSFAEDPDQFNWSLRGPSVNIRYKGYPPNCDFYYNELMVPIGMDPVGLYFMAIGFKEGYFGIQTISETIRTVIFAVWSKYKTDDPFSIPKEYDVQLIKKGSSDVIVESFGGEGSGIHAMLAYRWKAGLKYKFLVYGSPLDSINTKYGAWFHDGSEWIHVASFLQPKNATYLNGFYSFSEGINPGTSFVERKVLLGNQHVHTPNGKWHEIIEAEFKGPDKATAGRFDRSVGVDHTKFFIRSCGFFNETTNGPQRFSRISSGQDPQIQLDQLLKNAFHLS